MQKIKIKRKKKRNQTFKAMITQTFPKLGKKNQLFTKEKSVKFFPVHTNIFRVGLSKSIYLV